MRTYSGQGATVWAVVLVVLGFVLIGLGWRGAAATAFVPTQLAYTVSGGLLGLALIGAGSAIAHSQLSRVVEADAHHEVSHLIQQTAELLETLHGADALTPGTPDNPRRVD